MRLMGSPKLAARITGGAWAHVSKSHSRWSRGTARACGSNRFGWPIQTYASGLASSALTRPRAFLSGWEKHARHLRKTQATYDRSLAVVLVDVCRGLVNGLVLRRGA
jgi:hypothetical protein